MYVIQLNWFIKTVNKYSFKFPEYLERRPWLLQELKLHTDAIRRIHIFVIKRYTKFILWHVTPNKSKIYFYIVPFPVWTDYQCTGKTPFSDCTNSAGNPKPFIRHLVPLTSDPNKIQDEIWNCISHMFSNRTKTSSIEQSSCYKPLHFVCEIPLKLGK
jgi:hypothetical protein